MEESTHTNNPQEDHTQVPADPLGEAERKRDEYLAGWQRAKADFINYKKEESERVSQVVRYSTEDLIGELIVVLDNFDLAIATLEKQGSLDKGIYMIRSQLLDMLKKRGLEKIVIQPGSPFDPLVSETISEVDSEMAEGMVVEEVGSGYRLHDKVLRPARVTVSNGQKKI